MELRWHSMNSYSIALILLEVVAVSGQQHCTEKSCRDEAEKPVILRGMMDAGFRAAITNKGLEYLIELGIPLLENELMKLDIPEISGKADVTVAKVKYKFKNIHLTEANIGRSSLKSDPSVGLTLDVADISLRVEGDWSYKISWVASDSGSVRIKADGISLKIGILLGADKTGRPILVSTSCTFHVSHVSVKFRGGASWLYNLFDDFVEGKIKDALNQRVCDLVSEKIKKTANEALATFPVTVALGKGVQLSYALMEKPRFTPWVVVTDHKGEFFVEKESDTMVPFSPPLLPPLPTSGDSIGKMVFLWLTDYMANTAALVYMRLGTLSYSVTPELAGEAGSFILKTNFFSQMIPKLSETYPNKALVLALRCTDHPPTVSITPQGAQLQIPASVDFHVRDTPHETVLAFTLGITVSLDIQAWIETKTEDNQLFLKANATYLDAEMNELSSNIGDIEKKSVKKVWDAVSVLCEMFLMPQVNRLTNAGFPIPTVKGVTFVNPALTLGKGYVTIETDISYQY